ncbi:MAG: hypothetical protein JSS66_18975 [Armatimonadetes bacterium]|nr:hypothetical protein [Armatimonadota bacterium]
MAAAPIRFAANSSPGERAQLSGSRLINAIVEQLGTKDVIVKRAPGLKRYAVSNFTHCRGLIAVNDSTALVLYDQFVQSITLIGGVPTLSDRGFLAGDDLVTLARNNATVPDIVGVSPERGAFVLSTTGAPADYPDPDVGFPVSVCFIDGYFFFAYRSGQCVASGLNTTTVNPLDAVVAESHAGGLLRGVAFNGQLLLFGPSFCEVWQNTANATAFPFSRATVIQQGLAATNAIAGYEDGFTSTLVWVSSTNIVYQLNGYSPVRISTGDIERDLQNLTDKSSLRCFAFMNNGHAFIVVKSDAWTWVFDAMTTTWQERKSYQSETWRAERSVYAFGDWLLGDDSNGVLYRPDNLTYDEDGKPLVFDVTSLPVDDFPQRQTVARADFEVVPGTGRADGLDETVTDPTMWISWSDDSGATFGRPVTRKLGQQGKYGRRVSINRCGRTNAYGRQWNFKVSDPVFAGIMGGVMQDTTQAMF